MTTFSYHHHQNLCNLYKMVPTMIPSIQYDDMDNNNDTHDDIMNKFKNRNGGNNNNSRSNTPAFGQQQPELSEEDQQINEEYFIWKKNTPYLYDVLVSHD